LILKLDVDLLRRDGYILFPVDEFGKAFLKSSKYNDVNITKSNYNLVLKGLDFPGYNKKSYRGTKGFGVKDTGTLMNWEWEERCKKNIKKLGKYIISMSFPR
jgi:hypothetical protein